jgi:hypothetical protein
MSPFDAAVKKLASEHPERIPVLKVMCRRAADAEPIAGPQFDPESVRLHVDGKMPGNLSFFVRRGFITVNDESNQRYYEMPWWREIEQALSRLS